MPVGGDSEDMVGDQGCCRNRDIAGLGMLWEGSEDAVRPSWVL